MRLTASRIHAETILRELHRAHPATMVEVTPPTRCATSRAAAPISRSAAASRPKAAGWSAAGSPTSWGASTPAGYADEHGLPRGRADLKHHEFVGVAVWRIYGEWLERDGPSDRVAMHQGAATGLLAAVRVGVGLAVLPCIVAEHDPALVRCLPLGDGPGRELWLLTHKRLRHAPRVRAVMVLLGERLAALARAVPQRKLSPGP